MRLVLKFAVNNVCLPEVRCQSHTSVLSVQPLHCLPRWQQRHRPRVGCGRADRRGELPPGLLRVHDREETPPRRHSRDRPLGSQTAGRVCEVSERPGVQPRCWWCRRRAEEQILFIYKVFDVRNICVNNDQKSQRCLQNVFPQKQTKSRL